MKITLSIGFLFLSLFSPQQDKTFIEKFTIGEYSYTVYSKPSYIHDDDVHAEFFVINKNGKQISAFKTAKQKGELITKGSYRHTNTFIEFREYYHGTNASKADSIMKRYYPNKKGDLVLTEYTNYKHGVATITKY